MVADQTQVPGEVFQTVSKQLPDLQTQDLLVVSEENLSQALLDIIQSTLGSRNVSAVNLNELEDGKTRTKDLVLVNRLAASKSSGQTLKLTLKHLLRVLRPNGAVIFYEDMDKVEPAQVAQLSTMFDSAETEVEGSLNCFKLLAMVQTSHSARPGLFWILEHCSAVALDENNQLMMFRSFLDHTQYVPDNIEAYEWIFGKEFISPGGLNMNRRVICQFDDLEEGKLMLDVGSGLGGGVRQAARELGLKVTACDISANMMSLSFLRHAQRPVDGVTYMLADVMRYRFEPDSFDYVLTRDCIHHIQDMDSLLSNIYRMLKPGGQLIITMYGRGDGPFTDEFKDFVKSRRYYLRTLSEMGQIAQSAGFSVVETENLTPLFGEILKKELQRALEHKNEFLKRFSQRKYNALVDGWRQKLEFIKHDNHNWLKLKCTK